MESKGSWEVEDPPQIGNAPISLAGREPHSKPIGPWASGPTIVMYSPALKTSTSENLPALLLSLDSPSDRSP